MSVKHGCFAVCHASRRERSEAFGDLSAHRTLKQIKTVSFDRARPFSSLKKMGAHSRVAECRRKARILLLNCHPISLKVCYNRSPAGNVCPAKYKINRRAS